MYSIDFPEEKSVTFKALVTFDHEGTKCNPQMQRIRGFISD